MRSAVKKVLQADSRESAQNLMPDGHEEGRQGRQEGRHPRQRGRPQEEPAWREPLRPSSSPSASVETMAASSPPATINDKDALAARCACASRKEGIYAEAKDMVADLSGLGAGLGRRRGHDALLPPRRGTSCPATADDDHHGRGTRRTSPRPSVNVRSETQGGSAIPATSRTWPSSWCPFQPPRLLTPARATPRPAPTRGCGSEAIRRGAGSDRFRGSAAMGRPCGSAPLITELR